jgi:hypothetical protein
MLLPVNLVRSTQQWRAIPIALSGVRETDGGTFQRVQLHLLRSAAESEVKVSWWAWSLYGEDGY